MKAISGRTLARAVERNVWKLLRISGSHHIYGKDGSTVRLSIPVHGSKPLKAGLAQHLVKTAGIDPDAI